MANPTPQLQDYLTLNTLRHRTNPPGQGVAEHQVVRSSTSLTSSDWGTTTPDPGERFLTMNL